MLITEANVGMAFRIVDQKGIPLVGESFGVLIKMVRPGEVLIALFLFGPLSNLEGASKISSEKELKDYKKKEAFKHVGFFAVKKTDLDGVKDLY